MKALCPICKDEAVDEVEFMQNQAANIHPGNICESCLRKIRNDIRRAQIPYEQGNFCRKCEDEMDTDEAIEHQRELYELCGPDPETDPDWKDKIDTGENYG